MPRRRSEHTLAGKRSGADDWKWIGSNWGKQGWDSAGRRRPQNTAS